MTRFMVLLVFLVGFAFARSPVLEPVESVPVEVGGLEFSVVTEKLWELPGREIELQLRVTNPGQQPLLFPTFDSMYPKITSSNSEEVKLFGGRDATQITRNLLLRPGKSFSYPLEAKLLDSKREGGIILQIKDPTGSEWTSKSIASGTYSLSFMLGPTHYDFAKEHELPAPLWSAKGTTNAVEFQIILGETVKTPLER